MNELTEERKLLIRRRSGLAQGLLHMENMFLLIILLIIITIITLLHCLNIFSISASSGYYLHSIFKTLLNIFT